VSGSEHPVDAHLAALPQPQRDTLTALRATLRELLPDAEECISYKMPCGKVDGFAQRAGRAEIEARHALKRRV
jgi:uncharacterized protein YdhG (YjbR/CyaY superfamily)